MHFCICGVVRARCSVESDSREGNETEPTQIASGNLIGWRRIPSPGSSLQRYGLAKGRIGKGLLNCMQKIEAILQPSKLDTVKDALLEAGIEGMTILEARGHGRQKGHTEFYRGREYTVDLLPKVKIEIVVPDELKDKTIQAIIGAARTGKIGDGKIFVTRIDEAIRIRNDERGESAL